MGSTLRVGGWVKTGRTANKDAFAFLELNDGSCATNLQARQPPAALRSSRRSILFHPSEPEHTQVLVPASVHALDELKHTGASVLVEGVLKASPADATGQVVELHATRVLHLGPCDAAVYPIAKKKITLEFLREKVHLRTRTNTSAL